MSDTTDPVGKRWENVPKKNSKAKSLVILTKQMVHVTCSLLPLSISTVMFY